MTGLDQSLTAYNKTVDKNFQTWLGVWEAGGCVEVYGRADALVKDVEGSCGDKFSCGVG